MNHTIRSAMLLLFAVIALSFLARAGEAPTELEPDAACSTETCHSDITGTKYVHGPAAANECTACHENEDDRHEFTVAYEGNELCAACHDEFEGKVAHEPVSEDCLTCHSPHGGDDKAFLVETRSELCGMCHDDITTQAEEASSKHSVVLEGEGCVGCHNPHSSDFPKLLAAEPMDLCFQCHGEKIKQDKRTISNVKEEIAGKKFVHGPIRERNCTACHAAHGSEHFSMLKGKYPETFSAPFSSETYALCLQCHKKTLTLDAKAENLTGFRNGTLNLHDLHVAKKVKGRACRACHAAHASDLPHNVRASVPFGSKGWALPIGFKATETGGSCASGCHVPRRYDRGTPVDYGLGEAPK